MKLTSGHEHWLITKSFEHFFSMNLFFYIYQPPPENKNRCWIVAVAITPTTILDTWLLPSCRDGCGRKHDLRLNTNVIPATTKILATAQNKRYGDKLKVFLQRQTPKEKSTDFRIYLWVPICLVKSRNGATNQYRVQVFGWPFFYVINGILMTLWPVL